MKTRAAGKDSWSENDVIGVRIGDDGLVGQYKLNTDGSVKESVTPIYWNNTASASVFAWYPFEQQNNVDISNQSDGYENFDFLTATAEGQNYMNQVELVFKHKMAKVKFRLVNGGGITEEELAAAKVIIYGDATAEFNEGVLSEANQTGEEIISFYDSATKTGEALLIPQDMTGKNLFKVEIGNKEFFYAPTNEVEGKLESGFVNTYTILVKQMEIEVDVTVSASWNDKDELEGDSDIVFKVSIPENHEQEFMYSENVTLKDGYLEVIGNPFTISFEVNNDNLLKGFAITNGDGFVSRMVNDTHDVYTYKFNMYTDISLEYTDYVEAGDFYYDDNTWLPYFDTSKKCIGIVFKSGAGDGDKADYYEGKLKDNKIHGYAVALKDAHEEDGAWGIRNKDESLENEENFVSKYNGYTNTLQIRSLEEYETTNVNEPEWGGQYWAFKVASEYNEGTAPESSSGWYLPSIAQLDDIYRLPDRAYLFEEAGGVDFIKYINSGRYWSSTERDQADAWYFVFSSGNPSWYSKGSDWLKPSYVRAVLTF